MVPAAIERGHPALADARPPSSASASTRACTCCGWRRRSQSDYPGLQHFLGDDALLRPRPRLRPGAPFAQLHPEPAGRPPARVRAGGARAAAARRSATTWRAWSWRSAGSSTRRRRRSLTAGGHRRRPGRAWEDARLVPVAASPSRLPLSRRSLPRLRVATRTTRIRRCAARTPGRSSTGATTRSGAWT